MFSRSKYSQLFPHCYNVPNEQHERFHGHNFSSINNGCALLIATPAASSQLAVPPNGSGAPKIAGQLVESNLSFINNSNLPPFDVMNLRYERPLTTHADSCLLPPCSFHGFPSFSPFEIGGSATGYSSQVESCWLNTPQVEITPSSFSRNIHALPFLAVNSPIGHPECELPSCNSVPSHLPPFRERHHTPVAANFAPVSSLVVPMSDVNSQSSFRLGYFVPPTVKKGDLFGGLEIVWKKHFALLFGLLEGQWRLEPTDEAPKDGFTVFRDMAKVRFSCQFCFRGWTSMFGVVMFFYRWSATDRRGVVRFLLMGQSCNKCVKDVFETPMWYPEEAQKVMTNLFYDISSRVYGQLMPPFNRDRRHGRPRHQHIAQQCQGCVLHLCKPKKKTNSVESEDSVAGDVKSRSLLASSSDSAESSENGPGNCTTTDGLCRGVTALMVSGQNKSARKFHCGESKDACGNSQSLVYSNNIYREVKVGDAADGSDADDGVQRDPLVVAAIADVKKSLAEKSSYLKCRNPN